MVPDPPAGGDTGSQSESGALIFVSDASAEAERLTTALRGRGYPVIDVPLGLLVSRVAVQKPALILCDADAPGAVDTIQRLREVPGAQRIDVLFVGEPGRAVEEAAETLEREGSGTFVRPVDEHALLRKVEALIGIPSGKLDPARPPPANRAPVLVAATRRPYRYDMKGGTRGEIEPSSSPRATTPPRSATWVTPPPADVSEPSSVSHGLPRPEPPSSPSHGSRPESLRPEPSVGPPPPTQSRLSPELELLLGRAEQRVSQARMSSAPPSDRLSPEAELEAILPHDILAALDEPLDYDDDDDDGDSASGTDDHHTRTGSKTGQVGPGPTTAAGGASAFGRDGLTAGGSARPSAREVEPHPSQPPSSALRETDPPVTPPAVPTRPPLSEGDRQAPTLEPPSLPSGTHHGKPSDIPASVVDDAAYAPRSQPVQPSTTPPGGRDSVPPAPPLEPPAELVIPAALAPGDAVRALARAVRARYTGALAFEDATGIRRVVFRDGDFVTAATSVEDESLVAFLLKRGDLNAEAAAKLGRKLPLFGRHAGAALIAHGHLRQDDLWPVLRAHAEWLVGRVTAMERGAASVEREVPPRLQAEPAVFGGATGAEVLIEIVRRTTAPEIAAKRLGGEAVRLDAAENQALLGECALSEAENELLRSLRQEPLSELVRRAGPRDFAAVAYALVELGVLTVAGVSPRPNAERAPQEPDPLDHEALRARILTRLGLVEEGDYFAVLGVSRNATSYDVRRAYEKLRGEFEPSRILTAGTADMREHVDTILFVLDEAFEILSDDRRRERYRRALEASPR